MPPLAPLIEKAFAKGKPAAVALVINSPGGSAVQSSLIAARIRRLAAEKEVEVHAFVEDVAASGGYWLACAGDRIWVDDSSPSSAPSRDLRKLRLRQGHGQSRDRAACDHGRTLEEPSPDPFLPEKPEDVERLKALSKSRSIAPSSSM